MQKFGKAIIAILTAAIVAAYQSLSGDGNIEPVEWVSVAIAATAAVGVWLVPLAPEAKWTKTAVAVVLSVLQVLATVILGGLGTDEILLLLITAAGALGVYVAPATTETESGAVIAVPVGADS